MIFGFNLSLSPSNLVSYSSSNSARGRIGHCFYSELCYDIFFNFHGSHFLSSTRRRLGISKRNQPGMWKANGGSSHLHLKLLRNLRSKAWKRKKAIISQRYAWKFSILFGRRSRRRSKSVSKSFLSKVLLFFTLSNLKLHLDIFQLQNVLRDSNSKVFSGIHDWIRESFESIRSSGALSLLEAVRSYPVLTQASSKQLFTALVLTSKSLKISILHSILLLR